MRQFSMPFQVGWDIIHRCNLRCRHCYFDLDELSDPRSLSKDDALGFVDYLGKNGVFNLSIAGGEPLMYPYIVEVVERGSSVGMAVSLSTNAHFLTEQMAKDLRSVGLKVLQISIEGSTHGQR
jgi:MoaA/NifB/PqqE/SkfB family radical SAM enzyme